MLLQSATRAALSTEDIGGKVNACGQPGQSQYFQGDRRPVILFDGVCNLCNGGVNFMLDFDTEGVYRMAALQSTAGRELLPCCGRNSDDISSIVLVEPEGCFTKRCGRSMSTTLTKPSL